MGSPAIFNGNYVKLLKNALRLGTLSSDPSSPATGDLYYNSSTGSLQVYTGSAFSAVNSNIFDGPSFAQNYTLTASVAANALTIALKTKAGTDPSSTDPVIVSFRNATSGTGDYTTLSITSALSVVVSSGSTLGHISGLGHDIWVYLFNDAGTARLGVSQTLFQESSALSSTAEGGAGAADSNSTIYTGTAVTSKAFRVLGRMRSNQTTAGTWATAPSAIDINPIKLQRCAFEYSSSSGQTLTNSATTTITFPTRDQDSMNTVSSGVFTAPNDGDYVFNASYRLNSTGTSTTRIHTDLLKNGSTIVARSTSTTIAGGFSYHVHKKIFLGKGDTIAVTSNNDSVGGTVNLLTDASSNWFTGVRVGIE